MNLVFFAGRNSYHPVSAVLDDPFDLILTVTSDSRIIESAKLLKKPFTQVLKIDNKLVSEIEKLKPDIGIIADFGLIIPRELIDVFPFGILNIHPSLLPRYRGPTPVQTALLNGDAKTGLSIIKIDEELDHGPILFQEERIINPGDNTPYLLKKLFERSAEVLPEIINKYIEGEISPVPQDDKKAGFTHQLSKNDGYIDSENPPDSDKLNRMINALAFWPGVWTKYKLSGNVAVIKFHPGGVIHVEGKKPMSYKDFINGYPNGKTFLQKLSLI